MLNEVVYHKAFGKGVIVSKEEQESKTYITVKFSEKTCGFVFPDSFENFLEPESDCLKEKVKLALIEKQNKIQEEKRKKEEERAKAELQKAQSEYEFLKLKEKVCSSKKMVQNKTNIGKQLVKGQCCGTVAREIYRKCCEEFGWYWGEEGKFAKQQLLYSERATREDYSVWMLPHSNKTGTNNKSVENIIRANSVEQWWYDNTHRVANKRKRIIFYKEDGVYFFGGVYLFDGKKRETEKNGKTYYVETFNLVSDVYPEH